VLLTRPPVFPRGDGRATGKFGRLTGLTGKDETIWLRACLKACVADLELAV
jgi:hypothetical protein